MSFRQSIVNECSEFCCWINSSVSSAHTLYTLHLFILFILSLFPIVCESGVLQYNKKNVHKENFLHKISWWILNGIKQISSGQRFERLTITRKLYGFCGHFNRLSCGFPGSINCNTQNGEVRNDLNAKHRAI